MDNKSTQIRLPTSDFFQKASAIFGMITFWLDYKFVCRPIRLVSDLGIQAQFIPFW